MIRHAIGPMILAGAILAAPVLAATPPDAATSPGPATTEHSTLPPSTNMSAGMPDHHAASTTATPASQNETPRYTTADDQVRLGKVVGASVYNDQNQTVGSIDDVLMSSDHKASTAVISVGGFLGMGSKLVSVPFDQLKIGRDKITMPGATKASLTSMPTYKYNNA